MGSPIEAIEPRNQWCSHSYYTELARILWVESAPLSAKHGVDQGTADSFLADSYSQLILVNAAPAGNA